MRRGRPYDSGRVSITPGAKHLDPYANYQALALGWRREHAQRVWQSVQAVVAVAWTLHAGSSGTAWCTDGNRYVYAKWPGAGQ